MGSDAEQTGEQKVVRFLARLLEAHVPAVRCEYSPHSPLGYCYPSAEEAFGVDSLGAVALLEDLVGEGVLDRRLIDKVHVCPGCGWHTLNFVEVCPRCSSLDVAVETVLHHFACAYVGPWSEFKQGVDLICPKCSEQLRHMGLDYERPADTYVCSGCGYAFTDSAVRAICFRCREQASAEDVDIRRVYEYMPNAKTRRAVEYGSLQGLDIKSMLVEKASGTFRRDFLLFEINREIYRARRYESPLSLVLVDVQGLEPGSDNAGAGLRTQVFEAVAGTLRGLDVVSAAGEDWAAVLLPETPMAGAAKVAERTREIIVDYQGTGPDAALEVTCAVAELLDKHETGDALLDYAREILTWAMGNRPGTVVTADEWRKEAGDAS